MRLLLRQVRNPLLKILGMRSAFWLNKNISEKIKETCWAFKIPNCKRTRFLLGINYCWSAIIFVLVGIKLRTTKKISECFHKQDSLWRIPKVKCPSNPRFTRWNNLQMMFATFGGIFNLNKRRSKKYWSHEKMRRFKPQLISQLPSLLKSNLNIAFFITTRLVTIFASTSGRKALQRGLKIPYLGRIIISWIDFATGLFFCFDYFLYYLLNFWQYYWLLVLGSKGWVSPDQQSLITLSKYCRKTILSPVSGRFSICRCETASKSYLENRRGEENRTWELSLWKLR